MHPVSVGQDKHDEFSQMVQSFWTDLPKLSNSDNILKFPSKNPFLTEPTSHSIVVRDSYRSIYKNILESNKNNFLVCGTPGIGKSLFLFYLLSQLKFNNQIVVYRSGFTMGLIYVFLPNNLIEVYNDQDFSKVIQYLHSNKSWYLVDLEKKSTVPQGIKTVFVTNFKRNHDSQYSKHNVVQYMPVWEFNELSDYLLPLYPIISYSTFQQRSSILGGIPRLIFDVDKDSKRIIDGSLNRIWELDNYFKSAGEIYGSEDSHYIFHLKSENNFQDFKIYYSSDYVAEMIALRIIMKGNQRDLALFVEEYDHLSSSFSSLRDHLFKGYCHNILSNGGSFKIRCLEDSTKKKIKELYIKKCDRVYFDCTLQADDQKENKYYCSLSRNLVEVDSWIKNIGFFQITINPQNDINMIEMKKCISYSKSKLFFVVPSSLFESFKKQKFITTTGEEKDKKLSTDNQIKLKQYVLSVDISLSTEKRKAGLDLNTNSNKKVRI